MITKPRIAVVSPFLDKRHGTERCIVEQVERLASDYGYEVHLYCQCVEDVAGLLQSGDGRSGGRPTHKMRDAGAGPAPACRGCVVWHKISDIPGPYLLKYLWWLLANHLHRWWDRQFRGLGFDLVYSPGINCFDADVIAIHIVFHEFHRLARDELKLRTIPFRAWPRSIHRRLYYHLVMALEKRVYPDRRHTLAAVSGLTAGEIRRFFRRDDVHVIPNAVDLEKFNPELRQKRRAECRQRLGLGESNFVLLLVGNDWKKKGLYYLLKAVARCPGLPLVVLVGGRDDRTPYLEVIERLGLRGRVRFAGPSTDVMQFYAAADAYVGPSLHDSFALPPAEAMACGLPVITSANNGGSEMITEGVDGFVLPDPTDVELLAQRIACLYRDPELCQRIGENAARTAKQYTWEENARLTKTLLEREWHRKQN